MDGVRKSPYKSGRHLKLWDMYPPPRNAARTEVGEKDLGELFGNLEEIGTACPEVCEISDPQIHDCKVDTHDTGRIRTLPMLDLLPSSYHPTNLMLDRVQAQPKRWGVKTQTHLARYKLLSAAQSGDRN